MRMLAFKVGRLQTNCYIICDESGNAAVIDPGACPAMISEVIVKEDMTLRYILLTHGHSDHIGGVKGIKELFPAAKVAIGELDAPMLERAAESPLARMFSGSVKDYEGLSANMQLADGDVITLGSLEIKVMHTPGHTRGGVCYLVEDKLFSGDTLFREEVGRCDLEGGDYNTILRSISRLADLPGDYAVLPGHEEYSTLEHERQHNKYIQIARGQ